jgi:hypothetical protein
MHFSMSCTQAIQVPTQNVCTEHLRNTIMRLRVSSISAQSWKIILYFFVVAESPVHIGLEGTLMSSLSVLDQLHPLVLPARLASVCRVQTAGGH